MAQPNTSQLDVTPLQILVVGAGIGGLTAAIALRRQGHHVTLLEQSRFANELGAAIHLAPNANGLLKRFGVDAESFGSVETRHVTTFKPDGDIVHSVPTFKFAGMWQHKWLLAHRVHLHEALKKAALDENAPGKPCILLTSSRVEEIDCDKATVKLANGQVFKGDLIVGADGVRSKCRTMLSNLQPFPSGKSAFRFLIGRETVLADPVTANLVQKDGELSMWIGNDRRVVMYPTKYGELLNFVCIHPAAETSASSLEWNQGGNKKQLCDTYKGFSPAVISLLEKADVDSIKLWQLLDMETLSAWTKGRMVLLGDAAHPFLPHQGQGGACAIEDAASLAALLPLGVRLEDIPERLQLYEKCRQERAGRIQQYTRMAGEDLDKRTGELDMNEYTTYNFGHDEWDHTTQKLRELLESKNPSAYSLMPVSFGPFPAAQHGLVHISKMASSSAFKTASIKIRTSRTVLQHLLPNKSFSFQSPGTTAFATYSATTTETSSHFDLTIHNVKFTQADGTVVKGSYVPIRFEDVADPILSGREDLGLPQLFADLDIQVQGNDSFILKASWKGKQFAQLQLNGLQEPEAQPNGTVPNGVQATATSPPAGPPPPGRAGGPPSGPPPPSDDGIFVYKYIPALNNPGTPDVAYAVFIPNSSSTNVTTLKTNSGATVQLDSSSISSISPTLAHVVDRLAEIPVWDVLEGKLVSGTVGEEDILIGGRVCHVKEVKKVE